MKKFKAFFKIMKYELIRITRNKVVLTMLLGFSILLLTILSFVNVGAKDLPIGIYTGGMEIDEIGVIDVLQEEISKESLIEIESNDKGVRMVQSGELCFFISINTETSPVTAVFYYDSASIVGRAIKDSISEEKNQYAYDTTNKFLKDWGITLNKAYFDCVSFSSANKTKVTIKQLPFGIEVACCVSIIIMFGLAYSISRDNETQVAKNLSYVPLGVNKYLLSKTLPYILLAIAEIFILFLIGQFGFKIDYQANIGILTLGSVMFIIASSMLGLLFSLSKSQLSTVFLDVVAILLPLFTLTMAYVQGFPIIIQAVLYIFPITSFVSFLNSLMYSNIIVWSKLGLFFIQSLIYYIVSYIILKHRVKS